MICRNIVPGVAEPRPRDTYVGVAESLDDDAAAAAAAAAEARVRVQVVALEHLPDDDARGVLTRPSS